MKLLFAVTLVIGLLLTPLAVSAVENTSLVNETKTVDTSEETTNQKETSIDLTPLFGKVHATLLMSTEEAFGYLLMNDEKEKQAYMDEIATSEETFAVFEDAVSHAGENESALATGYEQTKEAYANMTVAADAMFTSFEKEGKPVTADVIAFEESVDAVFNATDNAWVEYHSGDSGPASADASVRALYGRLLSAVEESYAYPVLGDKDEKEDALVNFANFDTRVAIYEKNYPDTSFDDLKAVKGEIQKAAETMFATYEKDGTVNAEDAAALETLVEKMNADCVKHYNQYSAEKAPVAEETLAVIKTAVNATA